ncbi:SurA N-terminal domain-containing protein [Streptomyces sp. NPDC001941]|uniref:SurA N-terminal domain-containing protein n=1 Tax=Streptomyces sp. NPDC001941 TaxID=3154659 RepID=UPI003328AC25
MHRRTALSVSAALVAAAPLLSACGGQAHPGAAAVVGGDRIDVAVLQERVKEVRGAQQSSPQSAQLIKATGDLTTKTLGTMIFDQVVERAAEDAGVTVSRKEVQQARAQAVAQNQGEEQFEASALQQGVAPDRIDAAIRRSLLWTKTAQAIGADNSPAGQKKLQDTYVKASRALKVDVNPRYGTWNDQQVQLAAARTPWLVQQKQAAAPEITG